MSTDLTSILNLEASEAVEIDFSSSCIFQLNLFLSLKSVILVIHPDLALTEIDLRAF